MSAMFTENRAKIAQRMENGSMLIVFSGAPQVKRGDEFYPFAAQRNFYYATGLDKPKLVFVLRKDEAGEVQTRLYLERYDEHVAKWDGAVLDKEKAEAASGIGQFSYLDEFYGHVPGALVRGLIHTVYLDLENRSLTAPNTPELDFAKLLREKFPAVKIENAQPIFAAERVIKSQAEIENLRKAAQITREGFLALLHSAKPGMMEYELEAHLDYVYKKSGCRDRAFRTIMAGGKNACVLHYGDNNCKIGENDLVLVDYGAQWNWYSADVSRTFPVSGKFTERQKQLYNIVLEANKLVINMTKPGVIFGSLNEAVLEFYGTELVKIGLIKDKSEISKYYFHGVSHMLGLETHDVGGHKDLVLAPGMVFTVEPGLYIAEEGIGIRIEDDILVTADGHENLTAHIPKEIADIEAHMAKA